MSVCGVRVSAVSAMMVALVFAGCLGADEPDEVAAGTHPYPAQDGSEWPVTDGAVLTGPFALREVLHVKVPSFDGVELDGWVVLPDLPDGVRAPVMLWSAPYFGQCAFLPDTTNPTDYPVCHYDIGSDPELWNANDISEAVPVDFLRENGYAVAIFNVRGTGNSGGCFEWFGPDEQQDQAVLVEWLGTQDWSNGRVGMMGLSYHGTTPWEAAIQNPEHLKTIVVAGMVSDAYTFSATPQGAYFSTIGVFETHFALRVTLSPPLNAPVEHWTVEHLPVMPDRVCDETLEVLTGHTTEAFRDDRNGAYWDARRLIDRFPDITTSVFLTHGFLDLFGSGHQQQENAAWNVLPLAPKRMLEGQWPHQMPKPGVGSIEQDEWHAMLLPWLDYWLKGLGEAPPRVGLVDYEDGTGEWHTSTAWPPVEAHEEVLFLTADGLNPEPGASGASFVSYPTVGGTEAILCGGANFLPTDAATNALFGSPGTVYLSDPAPADLFLAGNPYAYLQISSSQIGGLVSLHLYDAGTDLDTDCADGVPDDVDHWASGTADLRFHDGVFTGHDFPVNEPTPVRIDITNFAEVLHEGHRLAVVASYGDLLDRTGQPWTPSITLAPGATADALDASHIVLPFVTGTLGGAEPTLDYPPRPFVPVLEG